MSRSTPAQPSENRYTYRMDIAGRMRIVVATSLEAAEEKAMERWGMYPTNVERLGQVIGSDNAS